ncbi:unnamed protein product [Rhizophagus irregularis]|nr:unnamed protein product [Rhizophagus irregularis]
MTTDSDTKNYVDWLERSIANEHINYYEYSDFKNIQNIGNGAFGSIARANWKHTNTFFALKSFINHKSTLKEVVNELKLHRTVNIHDNILRFYGITKGIMIDDHQMNNYILVLEYADSALDIQLGKREKIIYGTPTEYSDLYTKCWKYEPSERPNILEVVSILESIISERKYVIDNNIYKEKERYSQSYLINPLLNTYTYMDSSNSTVSRESMGLNDDLVIDNIPSIVLSNSNLSSQTYETVTTDSENITNSSSDSKHLLDSMNHTNLLIGY